MQHKNSMNATMHSSNKSGNYFKLLYQAVQGNQTQQFLDLLILLQKEQEEQKEQEQQEEEEEEEQTGEKHNNNIHTSTIAVGVILHPEDKQPDHNESDANHGDKNQPRNNQQQCSSSWDMLCWAAWHGNEIIITELIHLGYSSHHHYYQHQEHHEQYEQVQKFKQLTTTPLHLAARRGHLRSCWISILLNEKLLDNVDGYGNTPLHTAAANGQSEIVKCLLNYGSDWTRSNVYHFTPLHVAMNDEIRQILKEFAKDNGPFSMSQRDSLQKEQRKKYYALESELKRVLEESLISIVEQTTACPVGNTNSSSTHIDGLQDMIEKSRAMGLQTCLINAAKKRMEWIKVAGQIYEYSCIIKRESPTVTTLKLDEVNKFQKYLENLICDLKNRSSPTGTNTSLGSGSSSTSQEQEDKEFPQELALLIDESNSLCLRCRIEYDLYSTCQSLMDITCATESDKESLDKIASILSIAKEQELDKELVSNSQAILCRLSSELRLKISSSNIPTVRLPVPKMSPKEEKTYWQPDDIGSLVVEKRLPLEGEECHDASSALSPVGFVDGAGSDNFVWVKSAAYQKLEIAIIQLQSDIASAIESRANQELITSSQLALNDALDKLNILQSKDEADRLAAMAASEKSTKIRKTKKKKTTTKKKTMNKK